jgi:DnaJ-domain-containing protein 1
METGFVVVLLVLLAAGAATVMVRSHQKRDLTLPFMGDGSSTTDVHTPPRATGTLREPTQLHPTETYVPPPTDPFGRGPRGAPDRARRPRDASASVEYHATPTSGPHWDPFVVEQSSAQRARAARKRERSTVGPSHYDLLHLERSATDHQIERAYRREVAANHPDRFFDNPERRKEAERALKELNAAMRILRDPVRRAQYDANH